MQPARNQHPIWIALNQTIAQFIDPQDRDEFLDAVVTTAAADDAQKGNGAGDAYVARVIQSLIVNSKDGLREP
jgi:hypothetical protein